MKHEGYFSKISKLDYDGKPAFLVKIIQIGSKQAQTIKYVYQHVLSVLISVDTLANVVIQPLCSYNFVIQNIFCRISKVSRFWQGTSGTLHLIKDTFHHFVSHYLLQTLLPRKMHYNNNMKYPQECKLSLYIVNRNIYRKKKLYAL